MKKTICSAVVLLFISAAVSMANSIYWGVQYSSSYYWNDHLDAGMEGSLSSSSYLIQLIYAGSDNTIDAINTSDADGTGDDDVMVAYMKFGSGGSPRQDGKAESLSPYNNASYANGSVFYMRAWEGVSAGSGAIPVGVQWFGNSMTFSVTGYNVDPALESQDSFFATANLGGSSGTYAMQPVPEPTTIVLLGMGLALVGLRRRIAK